MAKIYARKKVVLAKIEPVYGIDAVPTNVLNAILTKDFECMPLEGEELKRELDKGTFGSDGATLVGKHVKFTFKVEAAGSGTAGNAPAWGVLVRGCGHSETVNAAVDVVYAPIDSGVPSLTFYFYHDKKLHVATGCRGKVKFSAKKRQYGYFEFEFMGLYAPVTATTVPVPTLTAFQKPVPFRASTVSCDLIGETVGLHEIELDFGQKPNFYEHSEEEAIEIEDREGTFNALFEATEIGTHDYYADVNNETVDALSFILGTVAGNIIEIAAPSVQLVTIKDEDVQGIVAHRVTGPLIADAAGEYTIIAR